MFHKCKNEDEIKKLYRQLALLIHPDKGGEHHLMILLTESYNIALEFIKNVNNQSKKEQPKSSKDKYEKTYEDVHLGSDRLSIIKEIYSYAKKHKRYKTDYLDSVNDFLEEMGYITSAQYNALVKNYYAFRMDLESE